MIIIFITVGTYIQYSGERAADDEVLVSLDLWGASGCAYECDTGVVNCGSYTIQDTYIDDVHDVTVQVCHISGKSRSQLFADGKLVKDEAFDLYDPINFHSSKSYHPDIN